MQRRTKSFWGLMALACVLAISPGCVIRRGWVVKWDWSLEAHRTGCRHRWFRGICRDCQMESSACCDEGAGGCRSGAPCRGGLGGLLHREEVEAPPPAPEPPGPSTFHPLPTRPVYGMRSEEADSYEAPERSIAPPLNDSENLDMNGEPIDNEQPPIELDKLGPTSPEEASARPRNSLRAPHSKSDIRTVGWQSSRRKLRPAAAPATCSDCTVRFRKPKP